jgi:hypothetical protein
VLELLRRIAIYKDTGAAVLDHDVAFEGLVHDGVSPRSVDGRVRAWGDSESCIRAGILTNDEFDDGVDRFSREHEHEGKYGGKATKSNGNVIPPTGKAFDLEFAQTSQWDRVATSSWSSPPSGTPHYRRSSSDFRSDTDTGRLAEFDARELAGIHPVYLFRARCRSSLTATSSHRAR